MQLDFFEQPRPQPALLTIEEHPSSDYAPRTGVNARSADFTVAFATDFDTAGERLTKKVSASYLAIPYGQDPIIAGKQLAAMVKSNGGSVNVAGNGIYSLPVAQADVNKWLLAVFNEALRHCSITAIRSGGQTGVDQAGLVVGIALGIPVTGLFPKGFKTRGKSGKDATATAGEITELLQHQAVQLRAAG